MGDDGFHGDGWYPHDGEGKIDSCPGPGCNCDEKNYGYHSSSSNGNVSTLAAILCTIGSFFGACAIVALLGIEDAPVLTIILWIVIAAILAVVASDRGW